jgi:hypothetical protein
MGLDSYLRRVPAEEASAFVEDPGDGLVEELGGEDLDLVRLLDGLHFVLNGAGEDAEGPLSMAFSIREGFNPDDEFPSQYLTPAEVKQVADALDRVTEAEIRSRYDAEAMEEADVYPTVIWARPETIGELVEVFNEAREFYRKARAEGQAMFISQS